ncbi:MAG: hypothetical protein JJ899_16595 [Alphaproteobacteria bacterium]|nr:hypothetical protein [Alphaproteobacteria bacterium]
MIRPLRIAFPLIAIAVLAAASGSAQVEQDVTRFFGSYVGTGSAENLARGENEVRDLDVTIEEFKDDGFTLKWITVVRGEDGARTGDDVRRREVEESFIPVEDKENVFILAPTGGLFQKSELPNPLKGDPVRWASIDGNAMTVYSLAINESGGSELQVYRRALTEKGMDITFQRLKDEEVVVRMKGTLVRTQ